MVDAISAHDPIAYRALVNGQGILGNLVPAQKAYKDPSHDEFLLFNDLEIRFGHSPGIYIFLSRGRKDRCFFGMFRKYMEYSSQTRLRNYKRDTSTSKINLKFLNNIFYYCETFLFFESGMFSGFPFCKTRSTIASVDSGTLELLRFLFSFSFL